MKLAELSLSSCIVAKADVASCSLGSGSALLDLEHSAYFSMNPVAAEIWSIIQKPAVVSHLAEQIVEKFDVAEADVNSDVLKLLADLFRLHLIDLVSV
jgi:hypothetical protein